MTTSVSASDEGPSLEEPDLRITDSVYDATFDGGPHQDSDKACGNGNTLVSVENKVNVTGIVGSDTTVPPKLLVR